MPSLASAAVNPARKLTFRAAALLVALSATGALIAPAAAEAKRPPNLVVITTDDQTLAQFNPRVMPFASSFFANNGTEFKNAITVSPSCCPARAAYITGQYPHNNGVFANNPGYPALKQRHNVLPAWLQHAGYRTGHFGKFMNHFGQRDGWAGPVRGWNRWFTTINYRYYNYRVAGNGKVKRFGERPRDYITSRISGVAARFLRKHAGGRKPVYAQIDHFAPHAEQGATPGRCSEAAQPAPGDAELFADEPLPQEHLDPAGRSFNEEDTTDKSPAIARRPQLGPFVISKITTRYRCQLASLAAVDRSLKEIRDALREAGALARTAIVFTSDNGFFHGEHRLPNNKGLPYEEGVRVPLLMRLPRKLGQAAPAAVGAPVGNIDIAPTLLELAGAKPCIRNRKRKCRRLDGRSLMPLVTGRADEWPAERGVLVEQGRLQYFCAPYAAIWSPGEALFEFPTRNPDTDECEIAREYYDTVADPMQLHNLVSYPGGNPYEEAGDALGERLDALRRCTGIEGRDRPRARAPFCE